MVVAQGARVTLVVPTTLTRLLSLAFPQVQVVTEQAFAPQDGYDAILPIPDLPFVMGLETLADIPAQVPYLALCQPIVRVWRSCCLRGGPVLALCGPEGGVQKPWMC